MAEKPVIAALLEYRATEHPERTFVKWHDEKYGVERSGHDWVKAHACTGVKTNCITAAAIYDRDAADSPILPATPGPTRFGYLRARMASPRPYPIC